jgi:hypothetical protein
MPNIYSLIYDKIKDGKNFDMGSWHCGTTHCVGGYAVIIHPKGIELEKLMGTANAARFIFRKSHNDFPIPNLTASNKAAMAFVKARANDEQKLISTNKK